MINVNAIIADVLRIPLTEITDETSMESNALWDSLSHMEIIYALENKLTTQFSGDEIIEMTSVVKINHAIAKKLGERLEA